MRVELLDLRLSHTLVQLRLLGQLAGDDVKALTSAAHQIHKPDWLHLEGAKQIPSGAAYQLNVLSDGDKRTQLIKQVSTTAKSFTLLL